MIWKVGNQLEAINAKLSAKPEHGVDINNSLRYPDYLRRGPSGDNPNGSGRLRQAGSKHAAGKPDIGPGRDRRDQACQHHGQFRAPVGTQQRPDGQDRGIRKTNGGNG